MEELPIYVLIIVKLCLTQFVRSSGVLLGWPIHHTQHHKLDRGIHNFLCYNSDSSLHLSSDSWDYHCCQPSEKKKIQFRCAKMCSVRKTKEFANSSLQNNEGRPAHAFKVSQACCDTDKSSWSKCLASLAFKAWWEYLFFLVCFVSNWTNIDTEMPPTKQWRKLQNITTIMTENNCIVTAQIHQYLWGGTIN